LETHRRKAKFHTFNLAQDEGEQSLHMVISLLPEKSPLPNGQTDPTDGLNTAVGGGGKDLLKIIPGG